MGRACNSDGQKINTYKEVWCGNLSENSRMQDWVGIDEIILTLLGMRYAVQLPVDHNTMPLSLKQSATLFCFRIRVDGFYWNGLWKCSWLGFVSTDRLWWYCCWKFGVLYQKLANHYAVLIVCRWFIHLASVCSQLMQFASVHHHELGAATRAMEQSLEQAGANVKWMESNYEPIVKWLANVTAVAAS